MLLHAEHMNGPRRESDHGIGASIVVGFLATGTAMDAESKQMCMECRALVNAGGSVLPHENLTEYGPSPLSNRPAPTDERYYLCNVCEQDWTLETRGRGWVAVSREMP